MHEGLSYAILKSLSSKLQPLDKVANEPAAYRLCWEHGTALSHALEQDLQYMGGGQGAPCIVDLSFSLSLLDAAQDFFRAIVKYPVRFQDDIRVVVTGWIHAGRIDVKVRHISAIGTLLGGVPEAIIALPQNHITATSVVKKGHPIEVSEDEECPMLVADHQGKFWRKESARPNSFS
jgi:hypothetical protein